jgi:hypothetical protein
VAYSDGLQTAKPRFDDAALVAVAEFLAAVYVAEIDLYASNPIAVTTERLLYDALNLIRERCAALDVAVRIDLDLHVFFLPYFRRSNASQRRRQRSFWQ